jgi:hypothetical protein
MDHSLCSGLLRLSLRPPRLKDLNRKDREGRAKVAEKTEGKSLLRNGFEVVARGKRRAAQDESK